MVVDQNGHPPQKWAKHSGSVRIYNQLAQINHASQDAAFNMGFFWITLTQGRSRGQSRFYLFGQVIEVMIFYS